MVEKSSGAVWGSVLAGGLVLMIFTFGLSFLGALIAWPIIGGVNSSKNRSARKESMKFKDQVPLGLINAGESTEMLSLFPVGQKPQLKFTLKRSDDPKLFSVAR